MRKKHWTGLGVLLGALALVFGLAGPALSQKPPAKMTLEGKVMQYSKLKDKETAKFLEALGPAVRDLLADGQQVSIPGLGTFRIVSVPAHRDMVAGRPATIPAANHVEFVPTGDLTSGANGPAAIPAETVTPFQYVPIPGRDPGMKVPNTRMPNVRTR
jgi:nucleoid DNA-binding protein